MLESAFLLRTPDLKPSPVEDATALESGVVPGSVCVVPAGAVGADVASPPDFADVPLLISWLGSVVADGADTEVVLTSGNAVVPLVTLDIGKDTADDVGAPLLGVLGGVTRESGDAEVALVSASIEKVILFVVAGTFVVLASSRGVVALLPVTLSVVVSICDSVAVTLLSVAFSAAVTEAEEVVLFSEAVDRSPVIWSVVVVSETVDVAVLISAGVKVSLLSVVFGAVDAETDAVALLSADVLLLLVSLVTAVEDSVEAEVVLVFTTADVALGVVESDSVDAAGVRGVEVASLPAVFGAVDEEADEAVLLPAAVDVLLLVWLITVVGEDIMEAEVTLAVPTVDVAVSLISSGVEALLSVVFGAVDPETDEVVLLLAGLDVLLLVPRVAVIVAVADTMEAEVVLVLNTIDVAFGVVESDSVDAAGVVISAGVEVALPSVLFGAVATETEVVVLLSVDVDALLLVSLVSVVFADTVEAEVVLVFTTADVALGVVGSDTVDAAGVLISAGIEVALLSVVFGAVDAEAAGVDVLLFVWLVASVADNGGVVLFAGADTVVLLGAEVKSSMQVDL